MDPGDTVADRYEIIDRLGAGGMGTVYRARHLVSQREVALKLLRSDAMWDERARRRFEREASAAAKIGHDGLVEVLDAGIDATLGRPFLVMELLEGETFEQRLRRRDRSVDDDLDKLLELLDALDALHQRGFVHRDLKPANVFVERRRDGTERVKLLDFGLTRDLTEESHTATGTAMGTPHYMSPELSMSAKSASPAADVWAVGVMLYETLAGERPFAGETTHAVIVRSCKEPHRPLRELNPTVSAELSRLVDACLEKDPKKRPASAGALAGALRRALRLRAQPSAPPTEPPITGDEPTVLAPSGASDDLDDSARREPDDDSRDAEVAAALEQETLAPSSRTLGNSRQLEPEQTTRDTRGWRGGYAAALLGSVTLIGGAAWWLSRDPGEPAPPAAASDSSARAEGAPVDTHGSPNADVEDEPQTDGEAAAASASAVASARPARARARPAPARATSTTATSRPATAPPAKTGSAGKGAPKSTDSPPAATAKDDDPGFASEWSN